MEPSTPARWSDDETIVDNMPILDRWLERACDAQPLKGRTVLLLQHQLSNHYSQTRALLALGVRPVDIHWIDIPYTARVAVQEAVRKLGVPAGNFAPGGYKVLADYAPYQRVRVMRFLRELAQDPPEKLLVLDDGSYFLDAWVHEPVQLRDVAIVEQTTRGIIKIEDDAAIRALARTVPVVNVARSLPKRELEPPFIGVSLFRSLQRKLNGAAKPGPKDHCLVLGYGDIGTQVAGFAARTLGYDQQRVLVYDATVEGMRRAREQGFPLWGPGRSHIRFNMVLGCSGRASFGISDHHLLEDGATLLSASSGTVELSRQDFIERADRLPDDEVWIDREGLDERNVHSDLVFHFGDRRATFLNAGFPMNFDGRVNSIPDHYIQPTTTMMCAAAVQAAHSREKGLVPLDTAFCKWLKAEFIRELAEEAHWIQSKSG